MSESCLTISLNEVLFYFTRAAFGVDAPIGLSEDFARSNIWISENGFDPSLVSIQSLKNLDTQRSSLAIKLEMENEDVHLFCPENKLLSALGASVSCIDWIEVNGSTSQLKISNVDSPLLIISALGANSYEGLKVFWVDQDQNNYQVNFISSERWEIISSSTKRIELSCNADIFISPLGLDNKTPKGKVVKKFNTSEKKLEILNSGVEVKENWLEVYDYFSRCLVKSSEESRASGAGAGLVDND